ncbi:uncharacterized protein LOC131857710 [Cryptomeria japonica]|uniref:uncharacterized protein LOC131857710 n=1 Tax=Cryptomeria japonica TaxID=3369 RepID=UPI0027DA1839|nr:uncharacterized protein LOC131857710 [Cryptomeria japonica]
MERLNTRWLAPSPSWFKLNFDGTAHSGVAVGGGIIRDNLGNLVLAYARNFGSALSNMAEALALFWGLKLALAIDAKRLIIEGDSKMIIEVTKGLSRISWMINNILKDIWSMIVWLEEFHIQHIYREGNSVADSLVGAGLEMKAKSERNTGFNVRLPILSAAYFAEKIMDSVVVQLTNVGIVKEN